VLTEQKAQLKAHLLKYGEHYPGVPREEVESL
jgi:hypothetical protein